MKLCGPCLVCHPDKGAGEEVQKKQQEDGAAYSAAAPGPSPLSSIFGLSPWARMVDAISSRLAFFPPAPASYEVRQDARDGQPYLHPSKRFFVLGVTEASEQQELSRATSPRCGGQRRRTALDGPRFRARCSSRAGVRATRSQPGVD